MLTNQEVFIRLFAALILGGLIGIEREGISRPAGLRTHILVCIGSALIMLTGVYLFDVYAGKASIDPARLGAQVISGIGFLGAGTILKGNSGVKGLTTAASLWSVAGIGLACGIGFFTGAITCTILILFSLIVFSKIEILIDRNKHESWLEVLCENKPGELGKIGTSLGNNEVQIRQIELNNGDSEETMLIKMLVKAPKSTKREDIINSIKFIDGVKNVRIE